MTRTSQQECLGILEWQGAGLERSKSMAEEKKGFFRRLVDGLTKTRDNIVSGMDSIFHGFSKIDDDFYEELEETLIMGDLGVRATMDIIEDLKVKVKEQHIKEPIECRQLVIDSIREQMDVGETAYEFENRQSVVFVIGVNGVGKTTTIGKLANLLRKKKGKKPLLIAADVYRPAAIDQLKQLGRELNIEVYEEGQNDAVKIAENGVNYAKEKGYDLVLIDTAGRLHVDEKLMDELKSINEKVNPSEIILVIDAMIGQDAINVINGFNDKLPLTGTILTKMDGDTKGGVALSARHLTGVPIKFIGTSEKLDGLTEFEPERMVSRILGNGDIMSIIEKAESVIDEKEAMTTAKKMQSGKMDLEDFLSQLRQIKKLGPLENLLKLLPGARKMGLNNISIDPKQFARLEAIISSMTIKERKNPDIIKSSRKQRIANGSGTSVQEVNKLLNQFDQMKKMMKMMKNGNFKMPF